MLQFVVSSLVTLDLKIKVDYDDDFDLALNGTIYPALKIKFFLKRRLTSHAMQVDKTS